MIPANYNGEDFIFSFRDGRPILLKARWVLGDDACHWVTIQAEFMQFTGLTDSEGVEIYEADLTQDAGGNVGQIVWSDDELGWLWLNEDEVQTPFSECVVIGNKYEHPDLLGDSK